MEFKEFPKMARLSRECIVTEKIDGTNAQVYIYDDNATEELRDSAYVIAERDNLILMAGSRTRWIAPGKQSDNSGFAAWVQEHAEELFGLGPGQHFGEWWGGKIQRGYGLTEKRFSLFNTVRWAETRPACCHVVPELFRGIFTTEAIETCLYALERQGSQAAPGFMNPEGIVVYHVAAGIGFKKTLDNDAQPKSLQGRS